MKKAAKPPAAPARMPAARGQLDPQEARLFWRRRPARVNPHGDTHDPKATRPNFHE